MSDIHAEIDKISDMISSFPLLRPPNNILLFPEDYIPIPTSGVTNASIIQDIRIKRGKKGDIDKRLAGFNATNRDVIGLASKSRKFNYLFFHELIHYQYGAREILAKLRGRNINRRYRFRKRNKISKRGKQIEYDECWGCELCDEFTPIFGNSIHYRLINSS